MREKFVVIRRRIPQSTLVWAFPGGIRNQGETEEAAVVREALEEVNLDVVMKSRLFAWKHPNTQVDVGYYHCELARPNQVPQVINKKEQEEIAEVVLVDAGEVLGLFTSVVNPQIRDFVLSFAQGSSANLAAE